MPLVRRFSQFPVIMQICWAFAILLVRADDHARTR
jgi:hypothetical protein